VKLGELFKSAIEAGIEADPRPREEIEEHLSDEKEAHDKLDEDEKEYFDEDRLTNPYLDSRVLFGDPETDVKTLMVGIDIGVPELLLVDRLREKGTQIDAVLAHHPIGRGIVSLPSVMHIQTDIMHSYGMPINVAEGIMAPRIATVGRSVLPSNHNRTADAARLLDIPLLCTHTPADNCVWSYLTRKFDDAAPRKVKGVLKCLLDEPEYREAKREGSGVKLFSGKETNRAGRVFISMTGGTEGAKEMFERLSATADVGTFVDMHISEDSRKEAEKHHYNVVIAGHMASDTVGMNLMLDSAEKAHGELSVIEVSGFRRHKRD
jgi:putative NIF3 family GTP cyclohydrolase 1 type 2